MRPQPRLVTGRHTDSASTWASTSQVSVSQVTMPSCYQNWRWLRMGACVQAVMALKDGLFSAVDAGANRQESPSRYLQSALSQISKASPLVFFPPRCRDVLTAMLRAEGGQLRPHQHSVQQANALLACTLLMNAYKGVDDWPRVRFQSHSSIYCPKPQGISLCNVTTAYLN